MAECYERADGQRKRHKARYIGASAMGHLWLAIAMLLAQIEVTESTPGRW